MKSHRWKIASGSSVFEAFKGTRSRYWLDRIHEGNEIPLLASVPEMVLMVHLARAPKQSIWLPADFPNFQACSLPCQCQWVLAGKNQALCHDLVPKANKQTNKQTNKQKQTNEQTNERTNERTNEQTNERTNERTNKQTNKPTNKQTNKQTNKRTNEQTNKQTSEQTNKPTNKQTNQRTNKQTNKPTNKQTNEQTKTEKETKKQANKQNKSNTEKRNKHVSRGACGQGRKEARKQNRWYVDTYKLPIIWDLRCIPPFLALDCKASWHVTCTSLCIECMFISSASYIKRAETLRTKSRKTLQ